MSAKTRKARTEGRFFGLGKTVDPMNTSMPSVDQQRTVGTIPCRTPTA